MQNTPISNRVEKRTGDPRYDQITKIAETLIHVATTETIGIKPDQDRASTIIAALNAALTMVFCGTIRSDQMGPALEDMIETMRANVEVTLKARGHTGP